MKPIWIVDDDQSIRFVLEKALAREDFAVRSFTNPRDVLSALDDEAPQVLVSDIRMPGGSGIELLTKVKERHPGLPVIIMTAYSDLDSAVSAFQGGAFEYLPKPFDVPKAVELIRRAVDESVREEVRDNGSAEMPDMPFDLQTRLLRVLSDGQFYRVGGHNPLRSNVRVIAATHQNLEERVKLGAFREDLFHRLNVIRLRLPALRERREDVPSLARFFLQKSAKDLGVEAKRITEAALARLMRFDFPGNVRQLENICHWLTVMAPAQVIEAKDLPPELLAEGGSVLPAVTASSEVAHDSAAPIVHASTLASAI